MCSARCLAGSEVRQKRASNVASCAEGWVAIGGGAWAAIDGAYLRGSAGSIWASGHGHGGPVNVPARRPPPLQRHMVDTNVRTVLYTFLRSNFRTRPPS